MPKTKYVLIRTESTRNILSPGNTPSTGARDIIGVLSSLRRARIAMQGTVETDRKTLEAVLQTTCRTEQEPDGATISHTGINNIEKTWRYTIERHQEDTLIRQPAQNSFQMHKKDCAK